MVWVVITCLALVAAGLWQFSEGRRKVAYALLAGPIGLIFVLLGVSHFSGGWGSAEIPASDIALGDPVMTEAAGAGYEFSARVHNNHPDSELAILRVRIRAQDCVPQSKESCEVIAESLRDIHVRIPAGQARDVEQSVVFGRRKPSAKGELRWSYTVEGAQSP